jgi:acyl-CoA thioester hydrolase
MSEPKIFTWRTRVRTYELDQFEHVNNAVYLNYMEEAATQASTDAGFSWDWYNAHGCTWLVHKIGIRYYEPAHYADELEVKTWVSDLRRVRSHREYEIIRPADSTRIARARADWVFLDSETLQPKRIPPEFHESFAPPNDPLEDLSIHIRNVEHRSDTHRYVSYREVQSYEIDTMKHVNNGVYLRWVEHAYNSALTSINWPLHRQLEELKFCVLAAAHEIEYFKPAVEGDRIQVTAWITQVARVRGAWWYEIRHADTLELLARVYSVGAFVSVAEGQIRPAKIDPYLLECGLRGVPG